MLKMKKNHILSLVPVLLAAVICLSGCSGIKKLQELEITSARITGITPNGLSSIDLAVNLGLDNPGARISLSEISCDVKHFGKVLGNVAVDPFTIKAKTRETYDMKANVKLGEGITLLEAAKLLRNMSTDDVKVDLHAKVKLKGGISKKLTYNDIPLKKLIETAKR